MILAKAREENKDFYEVLDYYLNLIRKLHIRTYDYLGEMRASTNPLAYCEGGFLGGNLKLTDKIKPILKSATASFGITAFNELQELFYMKNPEARIMADKVEQARQEAEERAKKASKNLENPELKQIEEAAKKEVFANDTTVNIDGTEVYAGDIGTVAQGSLRDNRRDSEGVQSAGG